MTFSFFGYSMKNILRLFPELFSTKHPARLVNDSYKPVFSDSKVRHTVRPVKSNFQMNNSCKVVLCSESKIYSANQDSF